MRLIRHIALVAGAVALTGCGLNATSADTSPTSTTTTPVVPASTPPQTPQNTQDTKATQDAQSSSPTSSPVQDSSAGAVSATPAGSPLVVSYNDKTGLLQLPVSNAAIPDAPAGLRDFARVQLKQMWHDQFQNDPGCEGIGQVRLKRATRTTAYVQVSWGATTPTCPQYAGNPGSWQVWSNGGGTWSVALEGEGIAACSDLVAHAIPRSVYPTCSDGTKKVANPVA